MVRPVSLRVEAAVVMSDTSYGVHSGLVCGSSSLQAGDSTRGLDESGVKARVSLLTPDTVVGVSLLLAGDRTFQKCGWINNCSHLNHCMQFRKHLQLTKILSSPLLSIHTPYISDTISRNCVPT